MDPFGAGLDFKSALWACISSSAGCEVPVQYWVNSELGLTDWLDPGPMPERNPGPDPGPNLDLERIFGQHV